MAGPNHKGERQTDRLTDTRSSLHKIYDQVAKHHHYQEVWKTTKRKDFHRSIIERLKERGTEDNLVSNKYPQQCFDQAYYNFKERKRDYVRQYWLIDLYKVLRLYMPHVPLTRFFLPAFASEPRREGSGAAASIPPSTDPVSVTRKFSPDTVCHCLSQGYILCKIQKWLCLGEKISGFNELMKFILFLLGERKKINAYWLGIQYFYEFLSIFVSCLD